MEPKDTESEVRPGIVQPPLFACLAARSSPDSSNVADGVRTCLVDLENGLSARGWALADVVNVRTYLPEELMTEAGYAEYNAIYRPVFDVHKISKKPSRATVGVATPTGTEVQMEVTVLLPRSRKS